MPRMQLHLHLLPNEVLHADLESSCEDHRKELAKILRYLGEVDGRRLYGTMGYRSLFAYCVKALRMSENEAGPRVAVARLAKDYPWTLEALSAGDVHLTGLFRLSAHMQSSNCLDLLGLARGKTVKEIDDLLASEFPKPDLPERLRALPARAPVSTPPTSKPPEESSDADEAPKKSSAADRTIPMFSEQALGPQAMASTHVFVAAAPPSELTAPANVMTAVRATAATPSFTATTATTTAATTTAATGPTVAATTSQSSQESSTPASSSRRKEKLEPLSATRHALQLTIGTNVRRKLERVRDLMSHRNRGGSYEAIVGAAVDLLLEKLEREKLGKLRRKAAPTPNGDSAGIVASADPGAASGVSASSLAPTATASATASPTASPTEHAPSTECTSATEPQRTPRPSTPQQPNGASAQREDKKKCTPSRAISTKRSPVENRIATSRSIPRAVRREVFARDGEQCSFVSEAGVRCDSRSFLEIDHVHPKARGGDDTVANTRVLCATHNRLAAEQAFGPEHICRRIRESRERRQRSAR